MTEYQIFTNTDCNLACRYCFQNDKRVKINNPATCKSYLEACYAHDYGKMGKSLNDRAVVYAIGGESLLHPQLLDSICKSAKELDAVWGVVPFQITVVTNGTLFNDIEVRKFVEKWKDHLYVVISVDGCREAQNSNRIDCCGNGTWEMVAEGIKYLLTIIPSTKFYATMTVTHKTLPLLADSFISLAQMGFTKMRPHPEYSEYWPIEEAPLVAQQFDRVGDWLIENNLLKKVLVREYAYDTVDDYCQFVPYFKLEHNYCNPGKDLICLGLDGQVYSCFKTLSIPNPEPIGSISGGVLTFNNSSQPCEFCSQYTMRQEICNDCPTSGFCRWCPIEPYLQTDYSVSDYLALKKKCGWIRGTLLAREWLRNKLLIIKNEVSV